jgi:hypothetical protein
MCVVGTQPWSTSQDPFAGDTVANGTVHDPKTGLTWQQMPPPDTYTQAGALQYCAGLSLDGGGWRLPTIKELATIADFTRVGVDTKSDPYAGTPFAGIQPVAERDGEMLGRFWSSSMSFESQDGPLAWAFQFVWYTTNLPKTRNLAVWLSDLVRCVR